MNRLHILLSALLLMVASATALAEFDVDQADSLNFEAFHKDKDSAVKLWESDDGKAEKLYTEQSVAPSQATEQNHTKTAPAQPMQDHKLAGQSGKKFEARERYTLSRSAATPYSAFYVIEALHKQMAAACTDGWEKLREWSVPVEADYFLYYEFRCL